MALNIVGINLFGEPHTLPYRLQVVRMSYIKSALKNLEGSKDYFAAIRCIEPGILYYTTDQSGFGLKVNSILRFGITNFCIPILTHYYLPGGSVHRRRR